MLLGLSACGGNPTHSAGPPAVPADAKRLPARLRRLTNHEYEATVSALLGRPIALDGRLPPDVRHDGYTTNADQPVTASWASRLDALARSLAHEATSRDLARLVPARGERTANDYVAAALRLGERAFRRPLTATERQLIERIVRDDATPRSGFESVLVALLQAPSLLYLSEMGALAKGDAGQPRDPRPGSRIRLDPYETASLLAYTVQGGPPDDELLAAAAAGQLDRGEERSHQARRLLARSETRHRFRRFVLEWLEVDGLDATAKSAELYPDYEKLRPLMLEETSQFVDQVMVHHGASLRSLLDGGFASVEPRMARFYGLSTYGPEASLTSTRRRGLLQQASFLSAHAHPDVTSPVKRGDFVLRKLLCERVPRPGEIGLDLVMPAPSTTLTTRQRFAVHSQQGQCNSCHREIDAVGFSFEAFDAMGRTRSTEHSLPVETRGEAELGAASYRFQDSAELTSQLAARDEATECFARHGFRWFGATSTEAIEDGYLAVWRKLPVERRSSLLESVVAWVESDLFVEREVVGGTE
ncbi:MAG TPA: DUF1592 domain-containing protein [Polyangiaceae bacterium]|nr:DUF1592 domain-containing protein [Polyangiaceae bacterium]